MSEILYHFTAAHLLDGIKNEGLTLGFVPLQLSPPKFRRGLQWLTINSEWDQSWNGGSGLLNYSRTAYRLTVSLPNHRTDKLHRWLDYGKIMVPARMFETLNAYGDPQNWFLHFGPIPPRYIAEITPNPNTEGIAA